MSKSFAISAFCGEIDTFVPLRETESKCITSSMAREPLKFKEYFVKTLIPPFTIDIAHPRESPLSLREMNDIQSNDGLHTKGFRVECQYGSE